MWEVSSHTFDINQPESLRKQDEGISSLVWNHLAAGPNIEFPESQTWTAGSLSCGRSQLGKREASVVVMDKLIFLSLLPATKIHVKSLLYRTVMFLGLLGEDQSPKYSLIGFQIDYLIS